MIERPLTPDDERHGKYTTYVNHLCRCTPCKAANAKYNRDLKKRRAAAADALRAAGDAA